MSDKILDYNFKNKDGKVNELKLAVYLYTKWRVNYFKLTRIQKTRVCSVYLEKGVDGLMNLLATKSKYIVLKDGKWSYENFR